MVALEQDWVVKAIASAANSALRKHEGYVDREDLTQEGYMYLLEHPELLDEDSKHGRGYVNRSVFYAMDKYGMRQRMLKDGTHRDDYFRYTAAMVEELIAEALEGQPAVRSASDVDDMPSNSKPASESGDRLAMIADIRQAFTRIGDKDRELLAEKFFGGDVSDEVLGITHGVSADAIRKRTDRALMRLAKTLNGDYAPKEKRRVVSNSTAQVWTAKWQEGA